MTDSNSKNKGIVALVLIIGIAAWFGYAEWSDSSRNNEIETTQDPAKLAYLLLDYRDEEYKSSATENNNEITVKFNLGEYSASSEITFLDESRYVYSKFFKSFKNKSISIIGEAEFTDIKGNKSRGKAYVIRFAPEQAKSINWENVQYLNLPSLAQEYWKSQE